jgi:hypothetical protein
VVDGERAKGEDSLRDLGSRGIQVMMVDSPYPNRIVEVQVNQNPYRVFSTLPEERNPSALILLTPREQGVIYIPSRSLSP